MSYVCGFQFLFCFFFFNDPATTEIYTYCHTLSRHDALPISRACRNADRQEERSVRRKRLSQSLYRRAQTRDREEGESQGQAHTRGCRGARRRQSRLERHRPDGGAESLGRRQEESPRRCKNEHVRREGSGKEGANTKARLMELNDALWFETIDIQILLRLGVATLVGLALGLDRELKGYDAGLRTHGLVALSASLMTVVAIALYYQLGGPQSRIDPLRVIEGMAAAIGIIAAGLIIVRGGEVRNLTTAAHIWLTAGIGIASGAGYFAVVLIAAGLAFVLLVLLRAVERHLPHENADEPG